MNRVFIKDNKLVVNRANKIDNNIYTKISDDDKFEISGKDVNILLRLLNNEVVKKEVYNISNNIAKYEHQLLSNNKYIKNIINDFVHTCNLTIKNIEYHKSIGHKMLLDTKEIFVQGIPAEFIVYLNVDSNISNEVEENLEYFEKNSYSEYNAKVFFIY